MREIKHQRNDPLEGQAISSSARTEQLLSTVSEALPGDLAQLYRESQAFERGLESTEQFTGAMEALDQHLRETLPSLGVQERAIVARAGAAAAVHELVAAGHLHNGVHPDHFNMRALEVLAKLPHHVVGTLNTLSQDLFRRLGDQNPEITFDVTTRALIEAIVSLQADDSPITIENVLERLQGFGLE